MHAPHVPDRQDVRFLLSVARAMHTAGTTAQSLEDALTILARGLGFRQPHFFSTPTSVMCAFGELEHQEVFLLRLAPAGPNIARLSKLDRVVTDVLSGAIDTDEALVRVEVIEREPSPYGAFVTILAYGLGSAGIARFLGGGVAEIAIGGFLGILTGVIAAFVARMKRLEQVYEPLAAFVAAFVATTLAAQLGPYARSTATLAGIIMLLPGLVLTNAVRELAERHLASGTARLAGAAMVLLGLTFGVALGGRSAAGLFGQVREVIPVQLPWWTLAIALAAAGISFVVVLKAEPRDAGWIVGASTLSYLFSSVSVRIAGADLGLFVAAMFGGMAASVWGRWRNRPQSVVLVPAILMLVPGSVGFRSLNSLLERNVIAGVQTAFAMVLAATAISAGLLLASSVAPGRRRAARTGVVPIRTGEHRAPRPPSL